MLKPAYDGIVDSGLLVDDSSGHLTTLPAAFEIDKKCPRVELLIERQEQMTERKIMDKEPKGLREEWLVVEKTTLGRLIVVDVYNTQEDAKSNCGLGQEVFKGRWTQSY